MRPGRVFTKKRIVVVLSIALLAIPLSHIWLWKYSNYNAWKVPFPVLTSPPSIVNSDTVAQPLPWDFQDLLVVLKSGTTELETKLKTHLRTVTSVVPPESLMVFSDATTHLGSFEVIDALEDLPETYRSRHPEFGTYELQRLALARGKIPNKNGEGWKLDKHKFLPMISKAWARYPHKSFYFFIEADTYVYWGTILEFLRGLDSSEALYMGAPIKPTIYPHPPFAYGGAGFVLSRGAMQKLFRNENRYGSAGSHQFGLDLSDECCGDAVLADALKTHGISIKGFWPMFNGDDYSTVPFGGDVGLWCEPFGTLHHISPDEMLHLWQWTTSSLRISKGPARYMDFLDFTLPLMLDPDIVRDNFDTQTTTHIISIPGADNASKCRVACTERDDCFRYQYKDQTCKLSTSLQVGRVISNRKSLENFEAVTNLSRIKQFRSLTFCPT